MNDPTVPLWIITEDDGRILCAHCRGCMVGQGETCSHIASVLFYIETFNRIRGKLVCTDKQCGGYCQPTAKTYHLLKFKTSTSGPALN